MTESEAKTHLERMLVALIRYRSVVNSELRDLYKTASGVQKWSLGQEGSELIKILTSATRTSRSLSPSEFLNFTYIAELLAPEIKLTMGVMFKDGPELPAYNVDLMRGWDPEREEQSA